MQWNKRGHGRLGRVDTDQLHPIPHPYTKKRNYARFYKNNPTSAVANCSLSAHSTSGAPGRTIPKPCP